MRRGESTGQQKERSLRKGTKGSNRTNNLSYRNSTNIDPLPINEFR